MADIVGIFARTPDRRGQVDQFSYPMRPIGQRTISGQTSGQIDTAPLLGRQRPWYVVQTPGRGDLHVNVDGSIIHYSQTFGTAYLLYGRG